MLRPLNLLNDFAELRTLLLSTLEMAAASLPSPNGSAKGSTEEAEKLAGSLQESNTHLLDAFLVAAGMNQILEDYLHRDVFALTKVSRNLPHMFSPPFGDGAAAASKQVARTLSYTRALLPGEQQLVKQQRTVAAFVQQLADHLARSIGPEASNIPTLVADVAQDRQAVEGLLRIGRDLLASAGATPKALQRSVVRLPACFRSFDQRPEDCQRIVHKFAKRWPERDVPLLVIGVRTSGSYLAPLCAAFLRAQGYQRVQSCTLRPEQAWLPGERDAVFKHIQPGGRALLVDDPPHTGSTLVQIGEALEEMGVARQFVHPVAPIFGSIADLPPLLQGYEAVYLSWEEWAIHSQLTASAVEADLRELLSGRTIHVSSGQDALTEVKVAAVKDVKRLPLDAQVYPLGAPVTIPMEDMDELQPFRGHVRGLYQAQLLDERSSKWFTHTIYVKGVGLGYLGAHSLTLAERLSEFLPDIYGLRDGLLYRAWIPAERRLSAAAPVDPDALAGRVAAYVGAHHQSLPLSVDMTKRLAGRHPLWLRANEDIMCHAFEGAASLVRPVLVNLAKYLLLQPMKRAAVIDGSMAPTEWFIPWANAQGEEPTRGLLKVGFDDRVFCNQDLDCCDPFYDLASAAAHYELKTGETTISDLLRQHYRRLTGETCSDERWLLYQLIALHIEDKNIFRIFWYAKGKSLVNVDRASPNGPQPADSFFVASERITHAAEAVQRTISRVQERYFGERFLRDVTPVSSGPLCAIDLDGVLEMGWLGSVAISPAGALALRALARHGYRSIIATGRSLDELCDRCQAYQLSGGMAEYGAVIYNHLTGETRLLLKPEEQADLDALRAVLQQMPGVYVSQTYRYAVRAYQVRGRKRRGLTPETLEQALQQVPGRERLRAIPGLAQTDFMVTTVDKGTGLTALVELLDGPSGHRAGAPLLAFAAGDTASDLAMFGLAKKAFAPANADAEVRNAAQMKEGSIHIMKAPYQAGLLQAVAQFLGHNPARCSTCRAAVFPRETNLLLTAFAARDVHGWGKLRQAALLGGRVALARWGRK
ncbi:MAG TPA: hypothetical protein VH599_20245 [Ktedonobacterales bacterium]